MRGLTECAKEFDVYPIGIGKPMEALGGGGVKWPSLHFERFVLSNADRKEGIVLRAISTCLVCP